jgi:hypothetical protein
VVTWRCGCAHVLCALSCARAVFGTRGYFLRPNCVRELYRAVLTGKRLVTLLEPEEHLSGLDLCRLYGVLHESEGMREMDRVRGEVALWELGSVPTAQQIYDTLVRPASFEPLEWNRMSAFQDLTMRLIASRLLPDALQSRTYLHGKVSGTHSAIHPPRAGFRHHLFVSDCNHGASDLVEELARHLATSRPPPPWWTSTPLDLPHCEGFLLYLTSETWTSGTHSATLGRHVLQALSAGVRLVLAHEMPGLWQEEEGRRVSRFETFFASDDGATPQAHTERLKPTPAPPPLPSHLPHSHSSLHTSYSIIHTPSHLASQELLDRGVYRSIAVPRHTTPPFTPPPSMPPAFALQSFTPPSCTPSTTHPSLPPLTPPFQHSPQPGSWHTSPQPSTPPLAGAAQRRPFTPGLPRAAARGHRGAWLALPPPHHPRLVAKAPPRPL